MKTLVNFRDLGGMSVAYGGKTKTKRILRAGEPVGLSDADKDILKIEYNVVKFVDFRSKNECIEKPDDTINGIYYVNIDIMRSMPHNKTSMDDFIKNANARDVISTMEDTYKQIVLNTEAQAGYKEFIEILLNNNEGAILFHCFAGKDRTGIAAMLVLEMLGVSKKDIFIDYLKTNESRKVANQAIIDEVKKQGYSDDELVALKTSLCVEESYLQKAYETILDEFGGVLQYVKDSLKISGKDIVDFKKMYLEYRC